MTGACGVFDKKGYRSKALCAQQTQENDGYTMIVVNIPLFYEINEMPIALDLARLDDSGGIGKKTLRKYEAQYPQSCRRMFNSNDNYAH